MQISEEIVEAVKDRKCVLFLGAMASTRSPESCRYEYRAAPPGGGELSRRLAQQSGYPDEDVTNLQRVSLHVEYQPPHAVTGVPGSRARLVKSIAKELQGYNPSPALRMLAALPFTMVVTTNYDDLFDTALGDASTLAGKRKKVRKVVYQPDLKVKPEFAPLDPTEEQPVLMKLHGDLAVPASLVITEEDYLKFIHKMSSTDFHPMHANIRARMDNWCVLFVGYSLKDYNLRLLFRTLRWQADAGSIPLSFSVDPKPDNLIVSVFQTPGSPQITFVKQDLWDFVPALYEAVMGKAYE